MNAITAPNAKARAEIAAQYIRRNPRDISRAFANCFEMGDSAEVIAHLRTMAARSPILRANWARFLSAPLDAMPRQKTMAQRDDDYAHEIVWAALHPETPDHA